MEGPSGEAELPLLTVKHELRNGERAGPGVARGRRDPGGPGWGKHCSAGSSERLGWDYQGNLSGEGKKRMS